MGMVSLPALRKPKYPKLNAVQSIVLSMSHGSTAQSE